MAKKCPKGFFCIETTAISFVLIIVILIAGLFYYMNVEFPPNTVFNFNVSNENRHIGLLKDPLRPPLKDGNYFPMPESNKGGMPINIKTNRVEMYHLDN